MNGAVICSCATAGNDKTIMPTQSQLVTYVLCRMHDCFLHISAAGRFKRHGSLVGMIVGHKPFRRTSMFAIPSRFAMSTPVRAQLLAIQSVSLRPSGALLRNGVLGYSADSSAQAVSVHVRQMPAAASQETIYGAQSGSIDHRPAAPH